MRSELRTRGVVTPSLPAIIPYLNHMMSRIQGRDNLEVGDDVPKWFLRHWTRHGMVSNLAA
jgi:hypothetical protein